MNANSLWRTTISISACALVERGFRVIWTPFATLTHHQSATRGDDKNMFNRDRFDYEKENMRRRYKTGCFEDRAFSPWYTREWGCRCPRYSIIYQRRVDDGQRTRGMVRSDEQPKPG